MAFGSYQPENTAGLTSAASKEKWGYRTSLESTAEDGEGQPETWKNLTTGQITGIKPQGEILQKVGAIRAQDTGIYGNVYKDKAGIVWGTPWGKTNMGQDLPYVPLTGSSAAKMPDGRQWTPKLVEDYTGSTHLAETQQEGTDAFGRFLGDYGMPLMAGAMGFASVGLIPGATSITGGVAGAGGAIGADATDMSLGAAGAINATDAAAGIGATAGTSAADLSFWEAGMSGGAPAGATGGAGALVGTPYEGLTISPDLTTHPDEIASPEGGSTQSGWTTAPGAVAPVTTGSKVVDWAIKQVASTAIKSAFTGETAGAGTPVGTTAPAPMSFGTFGAMDWGSAYKKPARTMFQVDQAALEKSGITYTPR